MNMNELKRILDESCQELAQILDDCRNGPAVNVRVVDIMEPMLREVQELKDRVFYDVEHSEDQLS